MLLKTIGLIVLLLIVLAVTKTAVPPGGAVSVTHEKPEAPTIPLTDAERKAEREAAKAKLVAAAARLREKKLVAAARKDVTASLRDPGSAVFGDVFYAKKGEHEAVCGMVNAKNAFGGYTGMRPFVFILPKVRLAMNDAEAWNKHCAGVSY